MASILDMIWPSNPISGTGAQPVLDPYQVQYQMAQTPQQLNGQPNPAYANLQQQYNQALNQQRGNSLSNTLISAGAGMLGARDRYGNAASFGPALAQGIQSGIAGRNAYTQQASQQALMQAEIARAGQQAAMGQQQMQLGQMELAERENLTKKYGFYTPDMIKLSLTQTDNATKLQSLANIALNPQSTPDQRQKAMDAYNMFKGTSEPINGVQILDMIYPKPMDPDIKAERLSMMKSADTARADAETDRRDRLREEQKKDQLTEHDREAAAMQKQLDDAWKAKSAGLLSGTSTRWGDPDVVGGYEKYSEKFKKQHLGEFPELAAEASGQAGMTTISIGGKNYQYPIGSTLQRNTKTGQMRWVTSDGTTGDAQPVP